MTNGIIIRHAQPEDIASFRTLRLEALNNHPAAFGQDYADAISKDNEYWVNRLKINIIEDALFFAEKDSDLIGMTGIHRSMASKTKHAAMIWGVYVKPEWRGNHISESLIHSCVEWAKTQSVAIIKLAVVTSSFPAIYCYEKSGFKTYGIEPKAILYDNIYYDENLMSLEVIK